jgi:predicted ATPase/DNA-binding CsgD family transcriptional regulator
MANVVSRGQVTGSRRRGLPAEATSFVGRSIELGAITELLSTARMVTVTGPAGVGKTRTSVCAAARVADRFPDGVCFADLGAISDPGLVAGVIAAALGVPDDGGASPDGASRGGASPDGASRGGASPDGASQDRADRDSPDRDSPDGDSQDRARATWDEARRVDVSDGHLTADEASGQAALLGWLRGKKLLLIMDTCEHLVDACAAFADTVLRAAAGVTVLATSRQPLDAPGEHAFPLPPLPAEDVAADLFAQRAAAVLPGFEVTAQNRADVVRLCERLDGIPLAIELAAVRLRALPLAELASQLESGIRTLTVSRRGTTPRHQTLRAAVEWSYQLCTPAEQTLWQRLSVFNGPFDVTAAERVCAGGPLPAEQVVHALIGLVDKSVLLRVGTQTPRYRLPAAVREFGADRLEEADEQEHFLHRLAVQSLSLAREFDERFRNGSADGADPALAFTGNGSAVLSREPDDKVAAAFRRLHREYKNVRAALGYALGPQDELDAVPARASAAVADRWRLGANLAVRLSSYWQVSGQLDEGRRWLDRVVDRFPEPAGERGLALGARGQLAAFQGDLDGALVDISDSVRLAEAAGRGGEPAVARGYLRLNLVLTLAGRYQEAMAAGETARQRLTACGHWAGLLSLEAQLALLHQLTGNIDEAIACCERGLARLRDPGLRDPEQADPGLGDPRLRDPWLGDPGLRDPWPGDPRLGDPGLRDPWLGEAARAVSGTSGPGSRPVRPGEPGSRPPGREAWLGGYLRLMSGLALFQRPGREQACGGALRSALTAWQQLGDMMGTAYAVEALGWLAAKREQFERAAWLLGAADQLWARTGRRLSGIALMEGCRQQAAKSARRSLGDRRYAAAYAHGGTLSLDAVIRDAVDETGGTGARRGGYTGIQDSEPAPGSFGGTGPLTKREREIAELVASGLSNREIAGRLFISKRTVDAHVDHIFSKLEISSRVQLTVRLRDPGGRAHVAGM